MRHSPWALALLALSLPAPALSDPLFDLPNAAAIWNEAYRSEAADPVDADRRWWRDPAERAGDDDGGPGPLWRPRTASGPFGRPSYGLPYGDPYADDVGDGLGYRSRYRRGAAPFAADGSGYGPGRRIPLAVVPAAPQLLRRCGPGAALVGAAIGGGLGAALSEGSRQRQWALPIGATVGGLLGGVLAGC